MQSSGMLRPAAVVRTDVSEERSASIIRVTRIGEPGLVTANVPSSLILVKANRVPETLILNITREMDNAQNCDN
jgi:hypothetical protein